MDLVNVRELFREREKYVDTTVTIGGWVRATVIPKISGLSL